MNGLNPMADDYFYRTGLIYLKEGDREGALKAYEGLKRTTSRKLEQALYVKLYPELQRKENEQSK